MAGNNNSMTTMALGRPFGLGMLYDYRNDQLIPAITVWKRDILQQNIDSHAQASTNYTISKEDSLHEKTHLLGVEASLKASLLCGLVDISGSAKYVNDRKMTKRQERVTLKYSTTVRYEQLTMDHLSIENMTHTEVFDQDIATHVVTAILYGAEAFFVFDRQLSKEEDNTQLHGEVAIMLKNIPTFSVSGKGQIDLTENEKKTAESLTCQFYGDFNLDQNPSTFDEAVKLYKQLPTLLGPKGEKAVAKQVWLYPLHLLNNSIMKIIREISNNLINMSASLIDELHEVKIRAMDLINDGHPAVHLNKKHVKVFVQCITEFEVDIKKKMMELLPKIRGNCIGEAALADLLKEVHSSTFNQEALLAWIQLKRREITTEEGLIRPITNEKTIHSSPFFLDQALCELECDFVLCLSLHLTDKNDSFLNDLRRYLNGTSVQLNLVDTRKSWVDERAIIASSRKNAKLFLEFVKANKEKQNIKFVIDDQYINKQSNREGIFINLYHNGDLTDFEIPSEPGKPVATEVYHNCVLLTWAKPQNGSRNVQQYQISHGKEDVLKSMTTTANDSESKLIENLLPNTRYRFKVQAITKIGVTMESDISDFIETKPPPEPEPEPGPLRGCSREIPLNAKWSQTGVTVAGGNGQGDGTNQLNCPQGLFVDDEQNIYIADFNNHRIVEWKSGVMNGTVIAGGSGRGTGDHLLHSPQDLIVDKETQSIIIADWGNQRVVRWPRRDGKRGETLISNVSSYGLTLDEQGSIYIADESKAEVRRYQRGDTQGKVVAGGNGQGNSLNQLSSSFNVFVDREHSVYVSDGSNSRVMKWKEGATQGIVVANQLSSPLGVVVDQLGTVYVAEYGNHRIMRWLNGAKQGIVTIGGNGEGNNPNQLNNPVGLSFDRDGNLYVTDYSNHRVQRFDLQ